ncbi:MAG TPA: aldolase/citrate lyase family protein [Acetobacteraceae bacterium]|nr:aldolase/citrate lyase family protein [Acetobacteraceae bacterium]
MAALRNPAREKLEADGMALGFTVKMVRSVEIASAAKAAGYDWLFLDCEHGTLGLDAAAQIAVAALEAGIAPIARVPNGEYATATRLLDNGITGIVVPHVDTPEEAKEIVQRLKYPPMGHRSSGGIGPHYGLRSLKIGEAAAAMNAANMTIVMLETPTAIENADAIAAVAGIDVLLIGTNDLCFEMGIPGEYTNARVVAAYERTIAACRKHGKWAGMGGIYVEEIMERYIRMGCRFNLGGADQSFMLGAAQARSAALRKFVST